MPLIPDDVDLSIVRDRLEGNMWNPFIYETVTNVPVNRLSARGSTRYLSLCAFRAKRPLNPVENGQ